MSTFKIEEGGKVELTEVDGEAVDDTDKGADALGEDDDATDSGTAGGMSGIRAALMGGGATGGS